MLAMNLRAPRGVRCPAAASSLLWLLIFLPPHAMSLSVNL
ncbi:hypothetical protein SAMN04490206_3077 [Pseudomonas umsongensis]|nr:hypothetical protein SAMN04490206_3077 [Pseudomonas umsongensis]